MGVVRDSGLGKLNGELSGHAEVNEELPAVIEGDLNPLATAANARNSPADQQGRPSVRPGPAQAALAGANSLNGAAGQEGPEVADDSFDFR
jgi:hypothetical protein